MGSGDTRWRWVIFVRSVLSTVENPGGPLFRALGRELVRRGQEVLFLEERGNPAVLALLRQRGAAGMAELREGWPELAYQTYERRFGADLVEWLGRRLATADVALVELGVEPDLAYWVGELTRPHLRTYLLDLMPDAPSLALLRERLDPSRYSGVICSAAAGAHYEERMPAEQRVELPIDLTVEPAERVAARLADLLLELVRAAPPVVP
jgi:hypothetical protein